MSSDDLHVQRALLPAPRGSFKAHAVVAVMTVIALVGFVFPLLPWS